MAADWSTLPEESRLDARAVVVDLLHDWIKYMEMRLLSIDWSEPPLSVASVLERAILQTRRHGTSTSSVRDLWRGGREKLTSLPAVPVVTELIAGLDADVAALEALIAPDRSLDADPEAIVQVIRRPGRRLRKVRDALAGGPGG